MAPGAIGASALIIAGGRGTRFWPASREVRPKPLFSIDGKTSLLANTISRLSIAIPRERIFVLAAGVHRVPFRRELRGLIPARNLILEPVARGTAVAIAYGAAIIQRRHGDGIIAVMPADHYITPADGFRRTLGDAIGLAAALDSIVVLGITPTRAESGYGYQKIGAKVGRGFKVERFVEKPAPALARRMVRSGKYLWNAGMFVMSTQVLARELSEHCPALATAAEKFRTMKVSEIERFYPTLVFNSFDFELIEKSRNILGVRARFAWHDVGSWDGLWSAVKDKSGNVLRGNVMPMDSERVLAHSDTRLLALFGVSDLVVVDTGDAILIAHRDRSQDIGRIVKELQRRGLKQYL
ncbi:MAG: sugar phosphate nucleotidyltransferase [Candidatus Binatus sp.]|uniref:mannose-1-phosphate guanylyltransferase n=1 Tax=Candidatus Binatus sp. TaxID=2811406 RepID=UPI0027180B10|nr:sugar phosphate nucleotidyltransferase [Candidatus Binatus sp.]MDO8431116.1 sugar phosphate nucleotidyltransferase [Candidatus Binatus sp.]